MGGAAYGIPLKTLTSLASPTIRPETMPESILMVPSSPGFAAGTLLDGAAANVPRAAKKNAQIKPALFSMQLSPHQPRMITLVFGFCAGSATRWGLVGRIPTLTELFPIPPCFL